MVEKCVSKVIELFRQKKIRSENVKNANKLEESGVNFLLQKILVIILGR